MRTFSPENVPQKTAILLCRICGNPVPLNTAKTDGDGKAIHEECYAVKVKLEKASLDRHAHSTRPWNVIAEEVTKEQDPEKLTNLVTELNQALDEQGIDAIPKTPGIRKPEGK